MEKAIERGTAAQSAPAPRKLTAQTIKAAIAASVSLVALSACWRRASWGGNSPISA